MIITVLLPPFLAKITDVENTLYEEKPELLHLMAHGLEKKYMPKVSLLFPVKNFLNHNDGQKKREKFSLESAEYCPVSILTCLKY